MNPAEFQDRWRQAGGRRRSGDAAEEGAGEIGAEGLEGEDQGLGARRQAAVGVVEGEEGPVRMVGPA